MAARAIADALQQFAGVTAVSVSLPDGVGRAGALLRGAGPAPVDDFFRDRVDGRTHRCGRGCSSSATTATPTTRCWATAADAQIQLDEVAAARRAARLHDLAAELGCARPSVEVPAGDPLSRFAAAAEFGEFTAAYLALGLGLDPGSRGPAERAH